MFSFDNLWVMNRLRLESPTGKQQQQREYFLPFFLVANKNKVPGQTLYSLENNNNNKEQPKYKLM